MASSGVSTFSTFCSCLAFSGVGSSFVRGRPFPSFWSFLATGGPPPPFGCSAACVWWCSPAAPARASPATSTTASTPLILVTNMAFVTPVMRAAIRRNHPHAVSPVATVIAEDREVVRLLAHDDRKLAEIMHHDVASRSLRSILDDHSGNSDHLSGKVLHRVDTKSMNRLLDGWSQHGGTSVTVEENTGAEIISG